MIIKKCELETVCGITSRFPQNKQPEIAFAGRSNVGKSSLINCLMNRKSLARTSSQPGKTQTINFYHINDAFYLVDLPGYGYTKAAREEKEKWGQMVERYLHATKVLVCVFLLVDIRHEASENDRMMVEWMTANGYQPVIIATKLDKLKRSQVAGQIKTVRRSLGLDDDALLFPFSAVTRQGRDEILSYIESVTGYSD